MSKRQKNVEKSPLAGLSNKDLEKNIKRFDEILNKSYPFKLSSSFKELHDQLVSERANRIGRKK